MYVNPPKRFSFRYRYGRGANKPLRGFRQRVWVYRAYMAGRRKGQIARRRYDNRQWIGRQLTTVIVGLISLTFTALTLVTILQHGGP